MAFSALAIQISQAGWTDVTYHDRYLYTSFHRHHLQSSCTMYCLLQYTATVSWDSLPLLLLLLLSKKGPYSFPISVQQTHLMLRSTAWLGSSQAVQPPEVPSTMTATSLPQQRTHFSSPKPLDCRMSGRHLYTAIPVCLSGILSPRQPGDPFGVSSVEMPEWWPHMHLPYGTDSCLIYLAREQLPG